MNEEKGKGISRKTFILVVAIATLMISITGATYAFFALSITNNNVVTGTTATADLAIKVTEQTLGGSSSGATKSGKMVPQLGSALGTAIGNSYKCVDANGNTVCKVYKIEVENLSTAAVRVNGTITFNNYSGTSNLRWRRIDSATTATTATANTSYAASGVTIVMNSEIDIISGSACTPSSSSSGCTRVELAKTDNSGTTNQWQGSDYTSYFVVVWVQETGSNQSPADAGKTFNATVKFEGENGQGVTSTITS